jgi:hypothetical protein
MIALLRFETTSIPRLTDYLGFDFYGLDIRYTENSEDKCLSEIAMELDSVRDKVLLLKLKYCNMSIAKERFIGAFKNLIDLRLYRIPFEDAKKVLSILSYSNIKLRHLTISFDKSNNAKFFHNQTNYKQMDMPRFSLPSLVSLSLSYFSSSMFAMFDFSNIKTLRLKYCILHDLPVSNAIEELEIICPKHTTENAFYGILKLNSLKSLALRFLNLFLKPSLTEIIRKLRPLKKLDLSYSHLNIEVLISCLLKDIQEIDFSGNNVTLSSEDVGDSKFMRTISYALCGTVVKKLHLNECMLDSAIVKVLRESSKWIEYISLREVYFIDHNAGKAFEDLIEHAEFRVCDLRGSYKDYLSPLSSLSSSNSSFSHSSIGKIIIDSKRKVKQKFDELISSGKVIPVITRVEASFIGLPRGSPPGVSNVAFDVKHLKRFHIYYHDYFPVYYTSMPENMSFRDEMKVRLGDFVIFRNAPDNKILGYLPFPHNRETLIRIDVIQYGSYAHIKFPPDRHTLIPPVPYIDMKAIGDYDFAIVIYTKSKKGIQTIERIPCHRSVLSSRSEMFKTMFSVPMKESTLQEMVTDNKHYKDFIKYLYTREISLNEENFLPLLDLAKMHFIEDLECKIRVFIYRNSIDIDQEILERYDLIF